MYLVFAIVDMCRCSFEAKSAGEVLELIGAVKRKFDVVALKNGFRDDAKISKSGYRDVKLIVKSPAQTVTYEGKEWRDVQMLFEIQVVHERWLEMKKATGITYKIGRARSWKELCEDLKKYLDRPFEAEESKQEEEEFKEEEQDD